MSCEAQRPLETYFIPDQLGGCGLRVHICWGQGRAWQSSWIGWYVPWKGKTILLRDVEDNVKRMSIIQGTVALDFTAGAPAAAPSMWATVLLVAGWGITFNEELVAEGIELSGNPCGFCNVITSCLHHGYISEPLARRNETSSTF